MTEDPNLTVSALLPTPDARLHALLKSIEEITKAYSAVTAMNNRAAQDFFEGEDRAERLQECEIYKPSFRFQRHLRHAGAFLDGLGIKHGVDFSQVLEISQAYAALGTMRAKYSEWCKQEAESVGDKILEVLQKIKDCAVAVK